MRIHIVQPVIPHYRISFFNELIDSNENINFYASEIDDIGVKSVNSSLFKYNKLGKIFRVCGFVWQSNVSSIISKLKAGDVLVFNGNPRYLSNFYLILMAKIIGVKLIWWGQGWSSKTNKLTFKIRSFFMLLADYILLYTEEEKKLFASSKLYNKVHFLNNGIDNSLIKKYRKEYLPDYRSNNLLFIGRLTEKSQLDLLIRAINKSGSDIMLHVIGDGPNKVKYVELVDSLGLNAKVTFYGSITCEKEIAKIANTSKLFVYPGDVGLSLIHAFNYGLPCIVHSSRTHHMPEFSCFKSGVTGKDFKRNSIDSLSAAIDELILNNVELLNYSTACRQIVSNDYNSSSMASNFFKLLGIK